MKIYQVKAIEEFGGHQSYFLKHASAERFVLQWAKKWHRDFGYNTAKEFISSGAIFVKELDVVEE